VPRNAVTRPHEPPIKVLSLGADRPIVSAKEAKRNFAWATVMVLVLMVVLQNLPHQ
jgi:hypothetical protein